MDSALLLSQFEQIFTNFLCTKIIYVDLPLNFKIYLISNYSITVTLSQQIL